MTGWIESAGELRQSPWAPSPSGTRAMLQHVLRRMGFGASQAELEFYGRLPLIGVVGFLLTYDRAPADVDGKINDPAYIGVTTRGQFSPDTVINDARQRWLFRMVHTQRPLQEKMALFWHNHFATAYSKVAATFGGEHATKMMDAKPGDVAGGRRGQVQLFRDMALGRFDELLVEVAKDPAMLVWLDGRLNVRARPQENFGRELMELFTTGVGHYTEEDVYAAARVFTGWNLRLAGDRASAATSYYEYVYNAAPARSHRQDVHLRGDARRLAHHPGPARGRRRAGRPRPDPRAGPAARDRRAPGPPLLRVLRQRARGAEPGAGQRACARPT